MLEVWSLEHREAQHSQDSLDVLAAKYTADLLDEKVSEKELVAACKVASRRWLFFPKMADILKAVDEFRSKPQSPRMESLQIESTTSNHDLPPEELERNRARLKTITDMLSGKLSTDEAVRAVEAQTHIQEFGK